MFTKFIFHIIYWSFALLLCILLIGYRSNWQEAVFLTLIFSPISIGSAYLITHYLLGKYLIRGRYGRFFLYIVYIVVASFFLLILINTGIFIFVADYQFKLMPPATQDLLTLFVTLFLLVTLFVAIQSVRLWNLAYQEKEQALKSAAEAELRFLKTQLHPHFLFNTLNNLYVLTLEKSNKAPQLVLKLSNLLDYILSAGKSKMVEVVQEIKIMNDFIYLESLRYADRLSLKRRIDIPPNITAEIPPMILITIVENCFKHGAMNNAGIVEIDINMYVHDSMLNIKCSNTYVPDSVKKPIGIGLINIQKQLDYLYGKHYELYTKKKGQLFHLQLTIPIHAKN